MIYKKGYYSSYVKADNSWFSDCCGASYVDERKINEKTKFTAAHKGIRVFDGIVGTEYVGNKQQLKHIKTRNGNITVSIRHAY